MFEFQILLASVKDRDVSGKMMPNLIYVSREKNKIHHHHHFKAGALNTLVSFYFVANFSTNIFYRVFGLG